MTSRDRRDDIDAIKSLKYRYLRCVDLRLWDELAQTLAPEVTATYGKRLSYTGRDQVVDGLKSQMTDDVITEHMAHHPEIEVDVQVVHGRAADSLVEVAEGADLLLVGSRGRGGFRGMLLGSVSQRVLALATCPVAILHKQ